MITCNGICVVKTFPCVYVITCNGICAVKIFPCVYVITCNGICVVKTYDSHVLYMICPLFPNIWPMSSTQDLAIVKIGLQVLWLFPCNCAEI